jgi:uncharacterized FlaG/YvyC family protein
MNALAGSQNKAEQDPAKTRAVVSAVKGLNKSEFLGQDRELVFGVDPDSQRPVVRIVERETGIVIDEIPPGVVLRLAAALEPKQ